MAKIYLVSCVSEKRSEPAPAADLYISDLFKKARRIATSKADQWFILSAEHGLVMPETITAPYDTTLNSMAMAARKDWAAKVLQSLSEVLAPGDEVTFLAGERYREFLTPDLKAKGFVVRIPMEGLPIGKQLHWLDSPLNQDVERFYSLLDDIERKTGGPRVLGACRGRISWPKLGVYFFFEPGETRAIRPTRQRVVRIGTHAITDGRTSTLWGRLRAHRGSHDGGGNHRGSIFRLHIGAALLRRDGLNVPESWGRKSSASRAIKDLEAEHERRVSEYLARTSVLWIEVNDVPSPSSDRAVIERNAIGMLTTPGASLDPPSAGWLGRYSVKPEIQTSGFWNVKHVGDSYSPAFLDVLERHVAAI